MATPFRWGILGCGNIARQFVNDVKDLPGHTIQSVASRSGEKAMALGKLCDATPIDSYADLLDDPSLDAIYVALPNSLHADWTIRSLKAGFHVLCEKPLATSASEAEKMFDAAAKHKKVLIEAFMYRCHPQTAAILEAVRGGAIGKVRHILTRFCFRVTKTEGNIRFDSDLAGGALMDVGVYCLDFARQIAGSEAKHVLSAQRRHESGVDVATSGTIEFDNGIHASFTCAMDAQTDNSLVISGTDGYLVCDWPWKPKPETSGYTIHGGIPPKQDVGTDQKPVAPPPQRVDVPVTLPLYALEAKAFAAACRGEAEPFMSRQDSIALANLVADARARGRESIE